MNKILFGTLGATVALMTACTDYVADIEEAHNEYVAAMQKPESATTSSSCVCNLQASNLLRDNFGNLYYDYSGPSQTPPSQVYNIICNYRLC